MSDRLPKSTRRKPKPKKDKPKPKGQVVIIAPGDRCDGCRMPIKGSFAIETGKGARRRRLCVTCFDPECAEVPADAQS